MKTLIFSFFGLFLAISSQGQFFNESHVPSSIKQAFQKQFPRSKEVEWSRDSIGYQVSFKQHGNLTVVEYAKFGNELVTVTKIHKAKLPKRVKRQLRDNYTTYALENAIKIISPEGEVIYETEIARAEEALALTFNTSGYLLSIESE
ncbi:MAG: hypothetical protein K2U26_08600 [Cyclobacteriaceae bacterium]|nr:hypothetical protein [Cyclobacteriaceae bacterium]